MKYLLALVLAACNPYLAAISAAPPGRAARLDEVHHFWSANEYRIEISQGVALALDCRLGGPCEHVKIVADNPAIAEVRLASLGVLKPAGALDQQTAAAVVIVGKTPGRTRVRLSAEEGHREILVTVVAPPG